MPPSDSSYPSDWMAIAEKDLGRVRKNLSDDPELAGFCLQQAIEKFLKAYLLSRGWELRRVHDLTILLDYATDYDEALSAYRNILSDVTDYYMTDRYPSIGEAGITEEEVSLALGRTMDLVEHIRGQVG